jgi:hypothetical protein
MGMCLANDALTGTTHVSRASLLGVPADHAHDNQLVCLGCIMIILVHSKQRVPRSHCGRDRWAPYITAVTGCTSYIEQTGCSRSTSLRGILC